MNRLISPEPDTLLVNRMQRFCLHDGPGIRTNVFLQGCSLRCWWCQNPDTVPVVSAAARRATIEELVAVCLRDARYWAASGGGVTISGGEPLLQSQGLAAFLTHIGRRGHHRAVETSGAVPRSHVAAVASLVDLWLWDLKAVSAELFAEHTGGDVAQSLDNLTWLLAEVPSEVVLRVPLIATFNAIDDEFERMARWTERFPRPVPVDLLPGHELGCRVPPGHPSPCPTDAQVRRAADIFGRHAPKVTIQW